MTLPSSKTLISILLLTFIIMVTFSIVGNTYEKEVLSNIEAEKAAKLSKFIFLFLASIFSISSITLFIRHFPQRAIKVAAIERPDFAKKLEKLLTTKRLKRITFIFIIIIILGTFHTAYEIHRGIF